MAVVVVELEAEEEGERVEARKDSVNMSRYLSDILWLEEDA